MSMHIVHQNEMEIEEPKIFLDLLFILIKQIPTCRITRLSAVDFAVIII